MQLTAFEKGWRAYVYKVPFKKLIVQLSILVILLTGIPARAHVFSQTVSLSVNNMPLQKVFVEIKKQTGYTFAYFESDLTKAKPVNINVTNAKLTEVLAVLFENQPLTYTIVDKVIVVKAKSEKKIVVSGDALPALPIDVRGKVVNEEGEPVAGVTVAVKGTKIATATTGEGEFVLRNVDPNGILVLTATNISSIEENINNRRDLVLHVKGKTGILDQVQVIAYGTTSQRFNTGNVGTVKAADIEKQPVNNPLLALQGRIPGVVVTQATGISGGGVTIRIQGQNSIGNLSGSGNDPLIIVDGVPYPSQNLTTFGLRGILGNSGVGPAGGAGNPLSYLNPADIESIDILKDADATAIYGSRAANGAVLITTKKGKQGKTSVNVDFQHGWSKTSSELDLLNTQQYLQMRQEAKRNDNAAVLSTDYDINGIWDTTRYTNWQKVLIGNTGQFTRATLGVTGGTSNLQYLVSGTYSREGSIFPGDFSNTNSDMHFSINSTSFNQRFRLQFSGNYSVGKNKLPGIDVSQFIFLAPDAPEIFKSDGSLNWAPDPITGISTWNNPFTNLYNQYTTKSTNLVSNAILGYRITPRLEVKCSFGYTNLQLDEYAGQMINGINPMDIPNYVRKADFSANNQRSWIIEPQINYHQGVGHGKLDVLLGSSIQQRENDGKRFSGTGFSSDLLMHDIKSAAIITSGNSDAATYRYNAIFARINYNLLNKYLINLTGRRDGSSRFGPNNQFNNFAAVGVGWLFSEESFIKKASPVLSFGKLKISYGTTGNDQIGDYRFMSLYSTITGYLPYQGIGTGIYPISLNNPYLQWEETRKLQGGVELGFFKDQFLLTINYVRNRSSNQLLGYALPSMTGSTTVSVNFPALVQNTAFEFSAIANVFKNENFTWSANLNLTIPRNKLISFPSIETSSYASSLFVGQPLNIALAIPFYGINPLTGTYLAADRFGNLTGSPNLNADKIFKNSQVRYYGGVQNLFEYKGIEVGFLLQFSGQKADYTLFASETPTPGNFNPSSTGSNQPVYVLRRWQKIGDLTDVGKFSTGSVSITPAGNRAFRDASFIKLKNFSFSWTLPATLKDKLHIQTAKFFVNAQNLFTLTPYIGLDPETGGGVVPPLRTITIGMKANL